jgi:hypothetical protein
MLKNNENQLQNLIEQYQAPYIERAEEIKRFFPVEEASDKMRELCQIMASDPNIKGIVDLAVNEMIHEGIAAISVGADGTVDFLSKADVFKQPE